MVGKVQPVEQRKNLLVQERNTILQMLVQAQRKLADDAPPQNASRFQQALFRVVKKLHMLQTENNLRQHTLKNLVGPVSVTLRGELEHPNEQVRDAQPGH